MDINDTVELGTNCQKSEWSPSLMDVLSLVWPLVGIVIQNRTIHLLTESPPLVEPLLERDRERLLVLVERI